MACNYSVTGDHAGDVAIQLSGLGIQVLFDFTYDWLKGLHGIIYTSCYRVNTRDVFYSSQQHWYS